MERYTQSWIKILILGHSTIISLSGTTCLDLFKAPTLGTHVKGMLVQTHLAWFKLYFISETGRQAVILTAKNISEMPFFLLS